MGPEGLLLPHAELMDRGAVYLLRLDRAPSQPGGPLAPRVDDDELRAVEEAFEQIAAQMVAPTAGAMG